jgi:hypothetical protein
MLEAETMDRHKPKTAADRSRSDDEEEDNGADNDDNDEFDDEELSLNMLGKVRPPCRRAVESDAPPRSRRRRIAESGERRWSII